MKSIFKWQTPHTALYCNKYPTNNILYVTTYTAMHVNFLKLKYYDYCNTNALPENIACHKLHCNTSKHPVNKIYDIFILINNCKQNYQQIICKQPPPPPKKKKTPLPKQTNNKYIFLIRFCICFQILVLHTKIVQLL